MGKVAFCFPGQGALEAGMGRELAEAVPAAMDVYRAGSEASGLDLQKLCFDTPLEELVGASGKLRVLDRLLLKLRGAGHRVVLFSQFSSMVDLLDDYATMRGFNFVRLTGSTNRVQRTVDINAFNMPGSSR